jgi:hypothetical protein
VAEHARGAEVAERPPAKGRKIGWSVAIPRNDCGAETAGPVTVRPSSARNGLSRGVARPSTSTTPRPLLRWRKTRSRTACACA